MRGSQTLARVSPAMISSGASYAISAGILIVLAVLISLIIGGAGLARLVVGADGRGSTSKAQALLWTFALSFALLSVVLRDPTKITSDGLTEDYLYLLGFPALTVVASKTITVQKTEKGTVAKPLADLPKDLLGRVGAALRGIFVDDAGNASLHDTQLIMFTLIAVLWYLVSFFEKPFEPFPNLPDTLLVLTGAATATYVGGKLVASQKPTITGIFPAQPRAGTQVTITGANFKNTGGPSPGDPKVSFAGTTGKVDSADTNQLTATIPDGVVGTSVKVQVLNADGLSSDPYPVEVVKKTGDGAEGDDKPKDDGSPEQPNNDPGQ
jgi:IPT/TIG domain